MIDGIINVYKEKGYTSHDVVAKMRGILKQKKIGHTGTLDPDAEGVLPVCLGKGTKLCDLLTNKDKTYRTTLLLGIETDTQDISGQILCEKPVLVTEEAIRKAAESFIGESSQIPPMYSALKQNGKKLYELARAGLVVERESRPIMVHKLSIDKIELPRIHMEVTCSKGTYIRTLCHDIGEMLGTKGCMESLLRTRVERFEIKDSLKLGEIEELFKTQQLDGHILKIDTMFLQYKSAIVREEFDILIHNGNALLDSCFLDSEDLERENPVRVYDSHGAFIGLYGYDEEKSHFQIIKMFFGGN